MKEELWEQFRSDKCAELLHDAAEYLQKVEAFEVLHVAGLALVKTGQLIQGIDYLAASLSLTAPRADWFANAAIVFRVAGHHNQSLLFAENGIKLFQDSIQLRYLRGLALVHLHRREEARTAFEEILQRDPTFYHAKISLAFSLQLEGRFDEAASLYTSITNVPPEDQDAINNNMSWSLMDSGKRVEALEWLRTKCAPTPRSLFNQSMLMLGLGMWPEGWDLYRHRHDPVTGTHPNEYWKNLRPPFATRVEELEGKRVLLFSEQAYGDTLQFIRYAEPIQEHAAHLTIAVPPALHRLTQHLIMKKPFDVISEIEAGKADFYDVALSTMDAPSVFRTTVDTIPLSIPYIRPSEGITLAWRGKLHVGLCWHGASRVGDMRAYAINERRSMPFEVMQPLLDLSDIFDFVSLQQPGDSVDDARLEQPITAEMDFLDTARIIDQVDLVITVDSAIAHLAGSMAKPVWLLNRFDGCWRWFWDGRTTSPWYPTMRIFNQVKSYDWSPVIAEVKAAMLQFFTEFTA